jgi:hypothetical protein
MQSRKMSAAETAVNYIVGYFLAWFIMTYLLRWLGFPVTKGQSGGVVAIFTAVSVVRSYAIRRFFNWIYVRANMNRTLIHPLDKRV